MPESPITALLTAYDKAFQRQFGERAPIVAGKDAKLAADLLKRYDLEKLVGWVDRFCRSQQAFIRESGYTFGVFHSQVGKIITAKPAQAPRVPTEEERAFAQKIYAAQQGQAVAGWTAGAPTDVVAVPAEAVKRQPKTYITDEQRAELVRQIRATKDKIFGREM